MLATCDMSPHTDLPSKKSPKSPCGYIGNTTQDITGFDYKVLD